MSTARVWGLALMTLAPLWAVERLQAQDPGDTRLSFEVASIRQNSSESPAGAGASGGAAIAVRGNRLTAVNAALRDIIRYAYQLETFQAIEGGPRWMDDRFDITAAIPESVSAADAQRLMLRTLLADRFKLSVRWATRDQSVYALVVARRDGRLGPGLKPSTMDCEVWRRERQNQTPGDRLAALRESAQSGRITCDIVILPFVARIAANGSTMGDFARALSNSKQSEGRSSIAPV